MSMSAKGLRILQKGAPPAMAAEIERALSPVVKAVKEVSAPRPSIRLPKAPKMSKAEMEYKAALQVEFPTCRVEYEAWTLRLQSHCKYTPDLTVWRGAELLLAVEVKGVIAKHHSAARSHLAFKTAVVEWPRIRWRYASKDESGRWAVVES